MDSISYDIINNRTIQCYFILTPTDLAKIEFFAKEQKIIVNKNEYYIKFRIGHGSEAIAYKALNNNSSYTLKVIVCLNSDKYERLKQSLLIQQTIDHPNIQKLLYFEE